MKNRKLLLLLTAPSLLVVGCTPENSSSSKDSVPSSSNTVVTSSPSKEGSIRNVNDLRALLTENMALPTSALRYTYKEKMPNETKAHTIFNTYDVKMTQNENFVRLVQEGKDTPIERYAGILDHVYYNTETGTGFDSASRKKIVDEVQSYDQEITLDDAQKNIQNIQNRNGLPFLFSNGEMGSLAGKINFLAAVGEKNAQISFSSVLGSDGKETVHYVSYYEEKSLDLDHPTSYDYDFTVVIENGKISEATLTGMAAATDNWDLDKHEPKEGMGTFMSFHLENVTYVDALPQTGTAPLLSTLPSYFITEIKHASFQDYMTGKEAVIRVGDSYFASLLDVDSFAPSTALDKATITITSSSDESVIGKGDYGSFEALKAGTTDLTLGNVFNPNLYTMKNVTVLPAEPSVNGIQGIENDAVVELKVNESKTYDLELSSYGEKGPWDLSSLSLSGGEGIVSSTFQMRGSDESDYGISLTLTGLKEGSANLSLNGTDYDVHFQVKVVAENQRPTLTIPAVEGVTLTQIQAGSSEHDVGEEISFYADPKTGYAIDAVYLVQGENKTPLTPGSQNLYRFTMPNGNCSIEFVVRKIATATISFTRPSDSVVSQFKVIYNPEGSTEEKNITSGTSVAVGTKIKIKLTLISGYTIKSISVSDGSTVTTVTANREYYFVLGSSDVTLTFDIQAESSTYVITIPSSNDYGVDSVLADGKALMYNNRAAKEGQSIKVTLYLNNASKSFSSLSVKDEKGNAVSFTQTRTTIDDPNFDPEFDHGDPAQIPAVIIAFTMPNHAVTITATVA